MPQGKAVQLDGKSTVDMGTSPAFDTGTRLAVPGRVVPHHRGRHAWWTTATRYALGVTGGKLYRPQSARSR